ncbi:response regulator [Candidatus Peregrinibacteria bacterium CG10_big_fil_rev_8_21_14_0_10_54_7]|nr:MAG: response regulator [Candidatus Peregrinibacteria bacterium CG10_big_fil_rev_8_21_14_0_10_54_7]
MARRLTLTTGEVAAHCEVTPATVWNWVRRGKLAASRTPGGHRRVDVADFESFLTEHGMRPYRGHAEPVRRVLVVDDDPGVLAAVGGYFRKVGGYEVATAEDGFDAGIQIPTFKPDLVILDLFIPQMDGFKVCQRLKASPDTAHVKVVVITGHPEPENLAKAMAAGADEVMTKPFRLAELGEVVEGLLDVRRDQQFYPGVGRRSVTRLCGD